MLRGGLILADPPPRVSALKLGVLVHGATGQLPNLDFVAIFTHPRLQHVAPVTVAADGSGEPVGVAASYADRLWALLRFVADLCAGPTGKHGAFLARGIPAVTLEPLRAAPRDEPSGTPRAAQLRGDLRPLVPDARVLDEDRPVLLLRPGRLGDGLRRRFE